MDRTFHCSSQSHATTLTRKHKPFILPHSCANCKNKLSRRLRTKRRHSFTESRSSCTTSLTTLAWSSSAKESQKMVWSIMMLRKWTLTLRSCYRKGLTQWRLLPICWFIMAIEWKRTLMSFGCSDWGQSGIGPVWSRISKFFAKPLGDKRSKAASQTLSTSRCWVKSSITNFVILSP